MSGTWIAGEKLEACPCCEKPLDQAAVHDHRDSRVARHGREHNPERPGAARAENAVGHQPARPAPDEEAKLGSMSWSHSTFAKRLSR